MNLYNSYTQKIEELKPIEPGKVSMYVCGPTVYNEPHVGNARPIVVFDTLKKALELQGLDVMYVSNYTDVVSYTHLRRNGRIWRSIIIDVVIFESLVKWSWNFGFY